MIVASGLFWLPTQVGFSELIIFMFGKFATCVVTSHRRGAGHEKNPVQRKKFGFFWCETSLKKGWNCMKFGHCL